MPGIIGYIKKDFSFNIEKMANSLLLTDKLKYGDKYEDNFAAISEVKLKSSRNKYINNEDFVVFVNGRCFNIEEVSQKFNLNAISIEELLYKAVQKNILDNVLNKINGLFEAVIYNKLERKILLISDRRGTHFLFYYIKNEKFIFGAEIKSILALKDIDLTIEESSFSEFMDLCYILEDKTWFKNIKLIKPSSILEYDIDTGEYNQRYYWKFSEIKQQNITFDEAVDKLTELLPKAVIKMYNQQDTIRVPLSGGLDSRMIAASLYSYNSKINQHFVTFGQQGCRDIEISNKIAKQMNQKHDVYDVTNEDVIADRKNLVWHTDGLYSILNLHGLNIFKQYPKDITTNFSGAVGGEIYGFVYKPMDKDFGVVPDNNTFENIFYNHAKSIKISDYYKTPHYHPVVIDNAIRKFAFVVVQYTNSYFDMMLPFLDNDLLDFLLSVPDSYKKDYKLYFSALKKAFPYWYTKIPFQSAGGFNPETKLQKWKRKFKEKIRKIFKIKQQRHFFDYGKYIKMDSTQKKMEEILKHPNEFLIRQHCDFISDYKEKNWENIKYNADLALKLITLKIYFDKISEITK